MPPKKSQKKGAGFLGDLLDGGLHVADTLAPYAHLASVMAGHVKRLERLEKHTKLRPLSYESEYENANQRALSNSTTLRGYNKQDGWNPVEYEEDLKDRFLDEPHVTRKRGGAYDFAGNVPRHMRSRGGAYDVAGDDELAGSDYLAGRRRKAGSLRMAGDDDIAGSDYLAGRRRKAGSLRMAGDDDIAGSDYLAGKRGQRKIKRGGGILDDVLGLI